MLFSISRITKNNTKEQKFRNLQPEFLNQFQADKNRNSGSFDHF